MSLPSRIANLFRGERLNREIDEELQSHLAEALEQGRDPLEAGRAFGPALRHREASRDLRLIPWLDSLRADAVFGWRQLLKKKATSAAAILSLALAIGACTSAFRLIDAQGVLLPIRNGTFIVRTSRETGQEAYPTRLASILRQEVPRARPEFRVTNIRTQAELNQSHTVRERLLAMLALFFGVVALLLAGVGLYGVLDYGVLQRRREIGIRMALGAQAGDVARRVTGDVFTMLLLGSIAGLAFGLVSVRYIEALLYQVKATDLWMLALPSLAD